MSLGENIRRLRQAKGWTQGDLSERTGIKVNHLSRLEQDDSDPKVSTLYKLIHALGCTPTGLLSDPDQSQEGTLADARINLIYERIDNLPEKAKMDLVEVLDRFCMGWEMELAVTQTARKWNSNITRISPLDELPKTP
jgi:transcriptional regulator with XRE-family HTH domain